MTYNLLGILSPLWYYQADFAMNQGDFFVMCGTEGSIFGSNGCDHKNE